jgi:hypothetical protein
LTVRVAEDEQIRGKLDMQISSRRVSLPEGTSSATDNAPKLSKDKVGI